MLPLSSLASVVINEIAWMGQAGSPEQEWIELYNPLSEDIDLADWQLLTADRGLAIKLRGIIEAKGFFLLARNSRSASTTGADLVYSGSLNNDGEKLLLINESGQTIEEIDASKGWPKGDNKEKLTMQRISFNLPANIESNWCSSKNINGTPRTENQCAITSTSTMENNPTSSATTEQTNVSFITKGVYINEILPSPEGPDAENEWIEIYNENSQGVNLAGWQIKDLVGATKKYTFPRESIIPAKGFLVITRPQSKISLQNGGDTLELISPDGAVRDRIQYESASIGQSFNRTEKGWFWSAALTPGKNNIIQISPTNTKSGASSTDVVEAEETISKKPDQPLAQIQANAPQNQSFFRNLILGAMVALVTTIAIILLRRRYNN